MGIKRASNRIDPAVLDRAVELSLAGRTLREIKAETGQSIGSLSVHLRADPRMQDESRIEAILDDEAGADLRETAREANRALRAICKNVAKRARGGEGDGLERAASGIASALDKAMKLGRLLAGRPTAHTKSERTETMTPEEKAEMDRLQRLAGKGEFQ